MECVGEWLQCRKRHKLVELEIGALKFERGYLDVQDFP